MSNVADVDGLEQFWAYASSEDLRRLTDLARRTFKASASAVLSRGSDGHVARWVSAAQGSTQSDDPARLVEAADLSEGDAGTLAPAISASLVHTSGRDLGRLCVVSDAPRAWDEDDRQLLADLAAELTGLIEIRCELQRKAQARDGYADTRAKLLAVADRIPGLVFERRKLDAGRSAYTFFGSGKTELPAVRQMMESGIAGLSFVHRDDRETVRAAILRSNLEETDLDLTFRIKDLDRTVRWIRSQSIVRRETDGSVCWDGLCFDITDLVAARDDAEAARRSKEDLLLQVSRDLRDPLQAIVGLAQLIEAEDQRERVLAHGRNIQIAGRSMIETVDQLLEQAGGAQVVVANRPPVPTRASQAAGRVSQSPAPAEADRTLPQIGVRVLLADDLDLNRKLIADMLSFEGHVVDCVADGAAAVKAARQNDYDLILMDMIMPGMDGIAATRAIRALPPPCCGVPIVALTANAAYEQLDACLQAGMDAALTKPMSMEALAAAVTTWTRGRKAA